MSEMGIWTKSLARRTLSRVLRAAIFSEATVRFLRDNSARRAAHELLVNPGSATPEAIKRRNGHWIPTNNDVTGPRPPQTPATSSKSPYRKCPGGTQSGPRGYTAPAHLSIGN